MLDSKFFRKAKRVNRAVEITDTEAVIPAVRDSAEIRVALPNRRPKTFEERTEVIATRREGIAALEEEIEVERKKLLELVKTYKAVGAGVAEVVVQNLKIKELMEQRAALARPETWIETLESLTLKDVFASKRDVRKIGAPVYQVKRRVEPITSLYVDLGAAGQAATAQAEQTAATLAQKTAQKIAAAKAQATAAAQAGPTVQKTIAEQQAEEAAQKTAKAAQGAIIGRKMAFKLKK